MTPSDLAAHLTDSHWYSPDFVDELDHTDQHALHAVEHSTIQWAHQHTASGGGP